MDSGRQGPPFEKAAGGLSHALRFPRKHCKGMLQGFDKEVLRSNNVSWTPPHVIDMLWTMKLEWNGVDIRELEKNPKARCSPDTVTYNDDVADLLNAMRDLKMCRRPRQDDLEATGFSPEVVKNTIKKLDVTLADVEESMQAVKEDRKLMQPLMKDKLAANDLLVEIEEIWSPSGKSREDERRAKWDENDDDEDDDEEEEDDDDDDKEDNDWRSYRSD